MKDLVVPMLKKFEVMRKNKFIALLKIICFLIIFGMMWIILDYVLLISGIIGNEESFQIIVAVTIFIVLFGIGFIVLEVKG